MGHHLLFRHSGNKRLGTGSAACSGTATVILWDGGGQDLLCRPLQTRLSWSLQFFPFQLAISHVNPSIYQLSKTDFLGIHIAANGSSLLGGHISSLGPVVPTNTPMCSVGRTVVIWMCPEDPSQQLTHRGG